MHRPGQLSTGQRLPDARLDVRFWRQVHKPEAIGTYRRPSESSPALAEQQRDRHEQSADGRAGRRQPDIGVTRADRTAGRPDGASFDGRAPEVGAK